VVSGTPAIVIAMVDSGIDLDHPDLSPNLWTNLGEMAGNGLDDDSNGYVDDPGVGTFSGTSDVWDDNGIGVAGVCLNCPRGARASWL